MNEQVMTQTHSQQHIQEERAGKKWLQHAELIAALVSGVLILAAARIYKVTDRPFVSVKNQAARIRTPDTSAAMSSACWSHFFPARSSCMCCCEWVCVHKPIHNSTYKKSGPEKSGSSMQNSLRRSYPASLFLRPGFLPKQKACPSLCISLPPQE